MTQEYPEEAPEEMPEAIPEEVVPEPIQKCANCGAELRLNDRYCGECGLPTFVPARTEPAKKEPVLLGAPTAASAPTPPVAPAAPPPPAKSDNRTWAVVTGVILLLIGAAACAIGTIIMLSVSWFAVDVDAPYWLGGTGLCCVLPAVLLMIAGGVVWYAWGRKKA